MRMTRFGVQNFLTKFISIVVLLGLTRSEEEVGSPFTRFPNHNIATTSLWQPTFDICQDPVHGGFHVRANPYNHITDEAWTELRDKMRNFHHTLSSHNLASRIYTTVAEMSYIFSILPSAGNRECCLEDSVIYTRLRNQVLPEVYSMVSGEILDWPLRDCVLEMRTSFEDILTCEQVRSLTLFVYQYGIDQSEHIIRQLGI